MLSAKFDPTLLWVADLESDACLPEKFQQCFTSQSRVCCGSSSSSSSSSDVAPANVSATPASVSAVCKQCASAKERETLACGTEEKVEFAPTAPAPAPTPTPQVMPAVAAAASLGFASCNNVSVPDADNSETHFGLNKLSIDCLHHTKSLIVGHARSGKTHLAIDLVRCLVQQGAGACVVITETPYQRAVYSKVLPSLLVYPMKRAETALKRVIARQRFLADRETPWHPHAQVAPLARNLVLVVDGVPLSKEIAKSPVWQEVVFNALHYNISLILTTQDRKRLMPAWRNGFDNMFYLGAQMHADAQALRAQIGNMTVDAAKAILEYYTADYGAVVQLNQVSGTATQKLKWYRAKLTSLTMAPASVSTCMAVQATSASMAGSTGAASTSMAASAGTASASTPASDCRIGVECFWPIEQHPSLKRAYGDINWSNVAADPLAYRPSY